MWYVIYLHTQVGIGVLHTAQWCHRKHARLDETLQAYWNPQFDEFLITMLEEVSETSKFVCAPLLFSQPGIVKLDDCT